MEHLSPYSGASSIVFPTLDPFLRTSNPSLPDVSRAHSPRYYLYGPIDGSFRFTICRRTYLIVVTRSVPEPLEEVDYRAVGGIDTELLGGSAVRLLDPRLAAKDVNLYVKEDTVDILMGGQRMFNRRVRKVLQQKVFSREGTPIEWRVLTAFLYHAGPSYLEIGRSLTPIPVTVRVQNLPDQASNPAFTVTLHRLLTGR